MENNEIVNKADCNAIRSNSFLNVDLTECPTFTEIMQTSTILSVAVKGKVGPEGETFTAEYDPDELVKYEDICLDTPVYLSTDTPEVYKLYTLGFYSGSTLLKRINYNSMGFRSLPKDFFKNLTSGITVALTVGTSTSTVTSAKINGISGTYQSNGTQTSGPQFLWGGASQLSWMADLKNGAGITISIT